MERKSTSLIVIIYSGSKSKSSKNRTTGRRKTNDCLNSFSIQLNYYINIFWKNQLYEVIFETFVALKNKWNVKCDAWITSIFIVFCLSWLFKKIKLNKSNVRLIVNWTKQKIRKLKFFILINAFNRTIV